MYKNLTIDELEAILFATRKRAKEVLQLFNSPEINMIIVSARFYTQKGSGNVCHTLFHFNAADYPEEFKKFLEQYGTRLSAEIVEIEDAINEKSLIEG